MTNKYSGDCIDCGKRVPARTGQLLKIAGKWKVAHSTCNPVTDKQYKAREDNARNTALWVEHMSQRRNNPGSIVATFNSGQSMMVNRNGRCEDAPCCGCCN